MTQRNRHLGPTTRRIGTLSMMLTVLLAAFALNALPAAAASLPWATFHDAAYGFSFSYPANWKLTVERDGSHPTLINAATSTTFSPIVNRQSASPVDVMRNVIPAGAVNVRHLAVSGQSAVDYVMPFVPAHGVIGKQLARPRQQERDIVFAVSNTASMTNVYTLQMTQSTDAYGRVSSAASADNTTFQAIVASFRLPAVNTPEFRPNGPLCPVTAGKIAGGPRCYYGCGSICWADDNYLYTKYNDAAALYCDGNGYLGSYGSYYCKDGTNYSAAQVPGGGWFQPYFQCAEFVSRAMGQDNEIPGLKNGGVQGATPATPLTGSYSYDSFPFTYVGGSYSSDTRYHLDNVGHDGVTGLYEYLINSGLAHYVGTDLSQVYPGDVIFFTEGSGFGHVMLVTGTVQDGWSGGNGWDAYLDGHNASAYHGLLKNWVANTGPFTAVDLQGYYGSSGNPSVTGSWNSFTDGYGTPSWWQWTEGSNLTAGATWSFSTSSPCAVAVYIPNGNATANVNFGVNLYNGTRSLRGVNESAIDGWALLFKWGQLPSSPQWINVSNNTGNYNQQLGISQMAFMC
ncbi:MAG TPA: hypothetical protein VFU88_13765 [Ktedonobacterales bacterium]|nr:hypothetical protein [Ktedonobacterales bacterium]